MALCKGSTAPGAWAQNVLPGRAVGRAAAASRYRPAGLCPAPARAKFYAPRQTVAARRTPAARFACEELFQLRTSDTILISWSTAIASAVPRRLPALPILANSIGRSRCCSVRKSVRRRRLPGFEFQSVAHAARVIFQNFTRRNAERQLPDAGFSRARRSPSSWCPHRRFSTAPCTTPRR